MDGWYYLHENGSLIYKREIGDTAADLRESDFVRHLWPMDPRDREGAWNILIEASAFGANHARVAELAQRWGCDDADADVYAARIGVTLQPDGNVWSAVGPGFTNLMESAAGFGETKLEAMADLARNLGLQPAKMWGQTFKGLLDGMAKAVAA